MTPDRLMDPEYSKAMERAQEVKREIADVEAKEFGYTQTDITAIDKYIQKAEQTLADFEKIKAQFEEMIDDLQRIHQKGEELLEGHNLEKAN